MQRHPNNLGVLRLALSLCVIFGHSPEMIDGNRSRELLTRVFHSMTLGEIAVDCFFLLSGYLITKSMLRTPSLADFLGRRVLRIYPGFIVAYLFSVYITGPLVGAHPLQEGLHPLKRLLNLLPPDIPGALNGHPYPFLNGSMWTIAYEFRCYLLIALLGVLGILARRRLMAALTLVTLVAFTVSLVNPRVAAFLARLGAHHAVFVTIGSPDALLRFVAVFLVGSCFFLFRENLGSLLTWRTAVACFLAATLLLYRNPLAELGVLLVGSFALFWLAFDARLGKVQTINDTWDLSYGVYLYAWPVANVIRWYAPGISPLVLSAVCVPVTLLFAAASWWGVERWTKDLVHYRRL